MNIFYFKSTLLTILLLTTHIFSITTAAVIPNLNSFGITLHHNDNSSTAVVTLTLWLNYTIFQCNVNPTTKSSSYHCRPNTWTILGTSCTKTNNPQYKIMIDNSGTTDAVFINDIFFWSSNTIWHGTRGWCIPNSVGPGYDASWKLTSNGYCSSGYTHYNTLCVDNDMNDCGPPMQLIYFDMNYPNKWTYGSIWDGYTNFMMDIESCNPTSDPTINPTIDPTYIPTNIPTLIPTINPTNNPSITPTKNPTNIPSISPTNFPSITPTNNPTNAPSFIPTNMPTVFPTIFTNNPSLIPSMAPHSTNATVDTHVKNTTNNKVSTIVGSLNIFETILVFILLVMFVITVCLVLILVKIKRNKMRNNESKMVEMNTITPKIVVSETLEHSLEKIGSVTDMNGDNENVNNEEFEGKANDDSLGSNELYGTVVTTQDTIDNEDGSESDDLYNHSEPTDTTQGNTVGADMNTTEGITN